MSHPVRSLPGYITFVATGGLLSTVLLCGSTHPSPQDSHIPSNEELLKRIDKLLDDKLSILKEEMSKDVRNQIDANNKQVLVAALNLHKSIKESLSNVADRAASFERSFKVLLMQTTLFEDHGPSIGAQQEPLDHQAREAYGFKGGDATRITKIIDNSPAQVAGLFVGDVIDWRQTEAKNYLPGDMRELPIIRRGVKLTISVRLTCKKCNSDLCPFTISQQAKGIQERKDQDR